MESSKTILMIALEYPPCQSAGVQRTLKFSEYLAKLGWKVIVLTAKESVYLSKDNGVKVPDGVTVYRTRSLDSSRDLAIKGKYFSWSQVPDRWWTWAITAIPLGKKLIEKYQPDILWSTYPASTAHYIGYKLHKFSKRPWVVDYRDPLQCRYAENAAKYSSVAKWIEKKAITKSIAAIFTTSKASLLYKGLYPDLPLKKFHVIENGFDEKNFENVAFRSHIANEKFTLLHSGAVYFNGRDPITLFLALKELKKEGVISSDNFEVVFRGANGSDYGSTLNDLGINELVKFKSTIPYKDSLDEMVSASALLLIQGRLFNNQIPGKAYEYIRSYRPILALTSEIGATGNLLNKVPDVYSFDDIHGIKHAIKQLISIEQVTERDVSLYSRESRTKELNSLLEKLLKV